MRLICSRFCPFKEVRFKAIIYLSSLGVTQHVLAEISGYSPRTIEQILGREKRKSRQ
jgi:hypothetical protein